MSKIDWHCGTCKESIAKDQGAFGIDQRQIRNISMEELEEEKRGLESDGWIFTDWDKVNPRPKWELFHWHCRTDLIHDANWYIIDIRRVETQSQFIEWVRHLQEKIWFHRTDMDNVMMAAQKVVSE